MKKYLLFLALVSCGNYVDINSDTAKKKAEEAKASNAASQAAVASKEEGAEADKPELKLTMGMSKTDVQKVLGTPLSVTNYTSFTVWYFSKDKCSNGYYSCSVQFTPKGAVEEVDSIDSEYLDLESF